MFVGINDILSFVESNALSCPRTPLVSIISVEDVEEYKKNLGNLLLQCTDSKCLSFSFYYCEETP